jgi:hypothetical protein
LPDFIGFGFSRPDQVNEKHSQETTRITVSAKYPPTSIQTSNPIQTAVPVSIDHTISMLLGVVLFEVGLWRRIEDILSLSSGRWKSASLMEIHQRLYRPSEKELGYRVGGVYRDIVGACLMREFGGQKERDALNGEDIIRAEESTFYW